MIMLLIWELFVSVVVTKRSYYYSYYLHVLYCHQPDDHGLIGDVPVLRVTRQGPDAIHFLSSLLEVGQEVHVKVDWERRFDHMQQHSGE